MVFVTFDPNCLQKHFNGGAHPPHTPLNMDICKYIYKKKGWDFALFLVNESFFVTLRKCQVPCSLSAAVIKRPNQILKCLEIHNFFISTLLYNIVNKLGIKK